MKKCKHCVHRGRTSRDEEICSKYLIYVGDNDGEYSCEGFEVKYDQKFPLIICLVALVGLLLLILI